MGGGARAVLLLHSFFQVTEFNKLGVKLLVLSVKCPQQGGRKLSICCSEGERWKDQRIRFATYLICIFILPTSSFSMLFSMSEKMKNVLPAP